MTDAHQSDAVRRGLGLLGAVAIGALLAMQSRINGELGTKLGDGIAAAVISFGGGLILLVIGTVALRSGRRAVGRLTARLRGGELRPWQCLGGVCGGYLVCAQGFSAGLLGVALFTVAVVAGQVISGLLVDRWGLGPGGQQPVTSTRMIGAGVTLVAVVIAVSANLGTANASWLVVLPVIAGFATAWQQAINGQVKQAADSALVAATLNFTTGTLALLLAFAVEVSLRGVPDSAPDNPGLYLGGVLGIFVIGGAALIVQYTGVLLLSMGMVGGQLFGAWLLDVFVPAPGTSLQISTLVGILLTLIGVGIAAWPSRATVSSARLPR